MKKENLSKYCKLATVLLIDTIPVWFTIAVATSDSVDSDFLGFGLLMMFYFFMAFNIWALAIYYPTKLINKIWLRDILYYLLLFLFLFSPFILLRGL